MRVFVHDENSTKRGGFGTMEKFVYIRILENEDDKENEKCHLEAVC